MVQKSRLFLDTFFQEQLINVNKLMPTATRSKTKKGVTKTAKKAVVKKAAPKKKTVAKKAPTAKKTVKKVTNFKALVCASDGECFWTTDGRILQNIQDLHMAFGSMDDEVFLHHVTKEKNDFADWVEYVLQDLETAQALRKAKKLAQAQKVINQQLRSYQI